MYLDRQLLKQAEQQGLLQAEQVDPLWHFLQQANADRPGFRASHLFYYFGGLLAIAVTVLAAGLAGVRDAVDSDDLVWTVPGAGLLLAGLGFCAVTALAWRLRRSS